MKNNIKLLEGRVGCFYMIGDNIVSTSCDVRDHKAEDYGGFVNYSSHYNLWSAFEHQNKGVQRHNFDMYDFPRGRVVYNKDIHKYIVYIDPFINDDKYLNLVRKYFNLASGGYIIDTKDEHYSSVEDPDDYDLPRDYIYDGILESYLIDNHLSMLE